MASPISQTTAGSTGGPGAAELKPEEIRQFQEAVATAEGSDPGNPLNTALAGYLDALSSGDPAAIEEATAMLAQIGIGDPDTFLMAMFGEAVAGGSGAGGGGGGGAPDEAGGGGGGGAPDEAGGSDAPAGPEESMAMITQMLQAYADAAASGDTATMEEVGALLQQIGVSDPEALAMALEIQPGGGGGASAMPTPQTAA